MNSCRGQRGKIKVSCGREIDEIDTDKRFLNLMDLFQAALMSSPNALAATLGQRRWCVTQDTYGGQRWYTETRLNRLSTLASSDEETEHTQLRLESSGRHIMLIHLQIMLHRTLLILDLDVLDI